MKTDKFIIENKSNIKDEIAIEAILKTIKLGLISNGNTEYCYVARFNQCVVEMKKTNYGYKIILLEAK